MNTLTITTMSLAIGNLPWNNMLFQAYRDRAANLMVGHAYFMRVMNEHKIETKD